MGNRKKGKGKRGKRVKRKRGKLKKGGIKKMKFFGKGWGQDPAIDAFSDWSIYDQLIHKNPDQWSINDRLMSGFESPWNLV